MTLENLLFFVFCKIITATYDTLFAFKIKYWLHTDDLNTMYIYMVYIDRCENFFFGYFQYFASWTCC